MTGILHVDDDPTVLRVLGRLLADCGTVRFATNGPAALQLARESVPDLIILDAQMPGMSGFQLFDSLRLDPDLASVPVIFLTSHSEPGFEACALEMGAADFIAKPFKPMQVLARVRATLRRSNPTASAGEPPQREDPLLALASRRQFDAQLRVLWKQSVRSGEPFALLAIHVDRWLELREERGRVAANSRLRILVRAMREVLHCAADVLARCADDEFALLLPGATAARACRIAQHLLRTSPGDEASPAFSIGVACAWPAEFAARHDDRGCSGDLILAARSSMHTARSAGGGQAWRTDLADPAGRCRRLAAPRRA